MLHPKNLLGNSFMIKGKVGRGEDFVFLEWTSCFHHLLLLQVEQASFLVPSWSS